jgi:hypothetical protein
VNSFLLVGSYEA